MEDLNYLCIFRPRVTMEQVMKREFLESSFLGMGRCGVHQGKGGLSNMGEVQEKAHWICNPS